MLLSRVRTAHILNTPQVRKWFYYGYLRHIGDTATLTAIEEYLDKLRINQHKVGNVRTVCYKGKTTYHNDKGQEEFNVTVDSGADTCLDGEGHLFLEYTERYANVVGFDDDVEVKNLRIGTSITAAELPSGKTVLLLKNEAIDHTSNPVPCYWSTR